ncbi:MAG: LysM peptidoglycan-binding domain-containing protein [Myxococcaceae bacterium]
MTPLPTLLLSLAVASGQVPPAPAPTAAVAAPVGDPAGSPEAAAPAKETRPAAPGDSDEGDDAEKASPELEEMRALEDATIEPTRPVPSGLQSVLRLGAFSPLRARIEDGGDGWAVDAVDGPELSLVTDVEALDISLVTGSYDIPVEMQPLVAQYIRFFQGPGRKWFRVWMSRSSRYIPMMAPVLEASGMPRDTVYLAMIESGFSPEAYSWARAAGPWQFISATARRFGLRQDFWVDERRDPLKATRAASQYLRELHDALGTWYLAWAGYNAGGEKVRRLVQRRGTDDFWELSEGRGLAKETKHYVPKLIACALVAKHPKAFGFSDDEFSWQQPLVFDEVPVVEPTDLEVLARAAGVAVEDIRALNPELRRWCTPPSTKEQPYLLRVPSGTRETFLANIGKVSPRERLTFRIHRVARGDTLSRIAASYHSAPEAIALFNHLKNARALRINTELAIPVPAMRAAAAKEGAPPASASTSEPANEALERQVARARARGVTVPSPEEEVPAGTQTRKSLASGVVRSDTVDGKTRVTYGVQSGDSLWTIATHFGVSVEDLKRWNHFGSLGRRSRGLQIGTLVEVWPAAGAAPAPPATEGAQSVALLGSPAVAATPAAPPLPPAAVGPRPTTHQLAAGETLWSVAQRYGLSVDDLKRWNRITQAKSLRAGTQLSLVAP